MVKVIILAGGKGTRLASVINQIPKPMAEIGGKPFLELLTNYLFSSFHDISEIILSVSYKAEIIQQYFQDHPKVTIFNEGKPKGTGGAIKAVIEHFNIVEPVLVLNGDSFNLFSLENFYHVHNNRKADITILASHIEDISRYGAIQTDENGRIIGFKEKIANGGKGIINNGIYFINTTIFSNLSLPDSFSFETDFLMKFYNQLDFRIYQGVDYFIDFGIPEEYERAKRELPEKILLNL